MTLNVSDSDLDVGLSAAHCGPHPEPEIGALKSRCSGPAPAPSVGLGVMVLWAAVAAMLQMPLQRHSPQAHSKYPMTTIHPCCPGCGESSLCPKVLEYLLAR